MKCLTTSLNSRLVAPLRRALETGTNVRVYSESALALFALAERFLAQATAQTERLIAPAPALSFTWQESANTSARHPAPNIIQ